MTDPQDRIVTEFATSLDNIRAQTADLQTVLARTLQALAKHGVQLAVDLGSMVRDVQTNLDKLKKTSDRVVEQLDQQRELVQIVALITSSLELDDVLPVVEAAELLGFATVDQGDIVLTPLGQTHADASILARKEIMAGRVLRLPVIGWIYETLQADDDGRVAEEYFAERLQSDFGEYAGEQLDTAINWGRYAELFEFDDNTDELYLQKA